MVVVTADSTDADIAIALGHMSDKAKRAQRIINVPSFEPSDWDCTHRAIDQLLTDWEARASH